MILNSPYITGSLTVTGNITASGGITISGSIASASVASLYKNNTAEISASTQIVSTTTKLYDLSDFKAVMMDYVVSTSGSGASMRAGTFTATWNATSSRSNESMTMDIGDTTAVQFSADKTGSIFISASSGTWIVDSLYRGIGVGYPTGSAPTPPPTGSGIYPGGRYAQQFTLYSPDDPLTTGSILYTDSGLTTPYDENQFYTNDYLFILDYPSGSLKYVVINTIGNTMPIPVKQTADLGGFPNYTAFTYPVPYDTLTEAYNNNAPVYNRLASLVTSYLSYFTGWTTISDGIYIFDYDDTTGLLSNPTTSSIVNGYSSFRYNNGNDACQAGNNARLFKNGTSYFSGSSFENGTTLYTDTSLSFTDNANTTASDGFYTFIIDSSGVVSEKTPYNNNFYIDNNPLYYGDNCLLDSGSITLYYSGSYGSALVNDGITYYTDICFTTPYTESGVFLNNTYEVYSVTTGSLTYIGACPAVTGSFGLSDIDGADACASSSISPISVYGIGLNPFSLSDAALYNTYLFYASNGNQVTASYISDGTNSYQIVQNISGSGFSAAILPATPC